MLPSSVEVAQSLRGSWCLMQEGEAALNDFDFSHSGLGKSFAAILLTMPALVAMLAAERIWQGLSNEAGLFAEPQVAFQALLQLLVSFVLIPAVILTLFWGIARTARGTGFVVAWNWTEVIITMILAVPAALFAAGFMKPSLALAVTFAFVFIAANLRYAVARVVLGLGPSLSLGVVGLTLSIEAAAAWALLGLRF